MAITFVFLFQVDKYDAWFMRTHTQDILRLEPNHLQVMLREIDKRRVGIGTGIFLIDEGFIVNVSVKWFKIFIVLCPCI